MVHLSHEIVQNEGYHPISTTKIALNDLSHFDNCSLFLYFALPPLIFVDPYELAHHEAFYTFRHWGPSNLELPVSAISKNVSHLLLNVLHTDSSRELEVKLPLHLRYGDLAKGQSSGYHMEQLPWPAGFLECPLNSAISSASLSAAQLPRLPIEVSPLFDQTATVFEISPVETNSNSNFSDLVRVPTGTSTDLVYAEFGTAFIILAAFLYLARAAQNTYHRLNRVLVDKAD